MLLRAVYAIQLIVANVNCIVAGVALQKGFVVGYALLPPGSTRPLSR